jgi:predicted chitinase
MNFGFDFDSAKLHQCLPTNKNHLELFQVLNEVLPMYDITTVNRVAGFLAQCGHESNDFNVLTENLNYGAFYQNGIVFSYFGFLFFLE